MEPETSDSCTCSVAILKILRILRLLGNMSRDWQFDCNAFFFISSMCVLPLLLAFFQQSFVFTVAILFSHSADGDGGGGIKIAAFENAGDNAWPSPRDENKTPAVSVFSETRARQRNTTKSSPPPTYLKNRETGASDRPRISRRETARRALVQFPALRAAISRINNGFIANRPSSMSR